MQLFWGGILFLGSFALTFKLARSKRGGFVLALLHIRLLKLVRRMLHPGQQPSQRGRPLTSEVEDEDEDEEGVPFLPSPPTQGGSKSG